MDQAARDGTSPKARLLLIEDDDGLIFLLKDLLLGTGYACKAASSGGDAIPLMALETFDLVLLDYSLVDMTGHDLVLKMRALGKMPPFIVLTGNGDERIAVELMKLGAHDYLVKDSTLLDLLPDIVQRVLAELDVKRQLQRVQAALGESESELQTVYDHAPLPMILIDAELGVRRINKAGQESFGLPVEGAPDSGFALLTRCLRLDAESRNASQGAQGKELVLCRLLEDTLKNGTAHRRAEVRLSPGSGNPARELVFQVSTARLQTSGRVLALLCMEDVTGQRLLEEQLRQAQKIEAVGQLTGGIAHDFNNILTSIIMQLDLLRLDEALPESCRGTVKEVIVESTRAASLTRQLLLFSRRQVMQSKPIDINQLLEGMVKMLRRLLGETISIGIHLDPGLTPADGDPGMIEQVFMNLCVNARDAMPKGGKLELRTRMATVGEESAERHPDAFPGLFVSISVSDTGCGMDEPTIQHIFEPFFTTKEAGKGTGLGLSTAHGIVKQHRGWMEVHSSPGGGSTFTVLLPASRKVAAPAEVDAVEPQAPLGHETILFVEDESFIRETIATALRKQGYKTIVAKNAAEAVLLWDQNAGSIDLLYTDMVMPGGMNGFELAKLLHARQPSLKVVLSSGYSHVLLQSPGQDLSWLTLLHKPCDLITMTKTLQKCLGRATED